MSEPLLLKSSGVKEFVRHLSICEGTVGSLCFVSVSRKIAHDFLNGQKRVNEIEIFYCDYFEKQMRLKPYFSFICLKFNRKNDSSSEAH